MTAKVCPDKVIMPLHVIHARFPAFFTHFSTDGGRALPRANLAGRRFLEAVARETEESLCGEGSRALQCGNGFSQIQLSTPRKLNAAAGVSQPQEGWNPQLLFFLSS